MSKFFENRGYPLAVIEEGRSRAAAVPRSVALKKVVLDTSDKVILAIPFCLQTRKIAGIIKRNARILGSDSDIGCAFQNNIMMAYKNCPNLKKQLVRASLPTGELPGTFPCGRLRCETCEFVDNQTTVVGPMGNYDVKHSYSCTSTDVVYALTCMNCDALYIGETGRLLGTRFREHVNSVKRKDFRCEVAVHMHECCNGDSNLLSVRGLCTVHEAGSRKCREAGLIRSLGTLIPFGMNKEKSSWQRAIPNV